MSDTLEKTLGTAVPSWSACPEPTQTLRGHHCCVRPIELPDDAAALYSLFANDPDKNLWDYFVYGPFDSAAEYQQWLVEQQTSPSQLFYVITDLSGVALGVAAYLRLDPANGSVEIGHLCFSSKIQRSSVATEAMYLMMKQAFELGYRRYEWKCHSLNQRSIAAAQRFGFQFEGVFRQHLVSKGRNRNTAWFSILDSEWPQIKTAFETWLLASNFDQAGRQLASLADLTKQSQLSVAIPVVDSAHG
jgi:RimJ/RimL family protein N-acetyltransferase